VRAGRHLEACLTPSCHSPRCYEDGHCYSHTSDRSRPIGSPQQRIRLEQIRQQKARAYQLAALAPRLGISVGEVFRLRRFMWRHGDAFKQIGSGVTVEVDT
jgi:hypothetical protein